MFVHEWIRENILKRGVDKVRFFAQMEKIEAITPFGIISSPDKTTWKECVVSEDVYKIEDGYKITLIPLDKNYASQHYYQSDFVSLVESGHILLKQSDQDHIEHIQWTEQLTPNVCVIHESDIVVQNEWK